MSAKEQLLRAHALGHDLTVDVRGPWPEHGDPHAKYRLKCSCGYSSTARRSRAALNQAMVWHLGRVISDDLAGGRVNGSA